MQIDEARGIVAKIWTEQQHRRKVMDPSLCDSFAHMLVDEVAKASLPTEPTVAQSRQVFAKAFATDSGFRKAFEANIAMLLHDDQTSDEPANLSSIPDCNAVADAIIKRIFES